MKRDLFGLSIGGVRISCASRFVSAAWMETEIRRFLVCKQRPVFTTNFGPIQSVECWFFPINHLITPISFVSDNNIRFTAIQRDLNSTVSSHLPAWSVKNRLIRTHMNLCRTKRSRKHRDLFTDHFDEFYWTDDVIA